MPAQAMAVRHHFCLIWSKTFWLKVGSYLDSQAMLFKASLESVFKLNIFTGALYKRISNKYSFLFYHKLICWYSSELLELYAEKHSPLIHQDFFSLRKCEKLLHCKSYTHCFIKTKQCNCSI